MKSSCCDADIIGEIDKDGFGRCANCKEMSDICAEEEVRKKFDCYSCKYRDSVPGSCHSSCRHPSLDGVWKDSLLSVIGIFNRLIKSPHPFVENKEMNILANPHGVVNGWFSFPVNFDPCWLANCDGYLKK